VRALVVNCTLKQSPEPSDTEAPASVVTERLTRIGYTIPGPAWTYWHPGPGPGPGHLEEQRGRERAHRTGRAMADSLCGVARAREARPLRAPGTE
jgi:hypothetical protein